MNSQLVRSNLVALLEQISITDFNNKLTTMSDKENFSSQYQYNIKETSNENKELYQLGDY